ncbi:MAG: hypothetical protein VKJ04_02975 [Vampirovibrionales bacterium]|nr:hypothetical protein [Vampirovibrionales bacterium]
MAELTQQPWPDDWPSNNKRAKDAQLARQESERAFEQRRYGDLRRQILRESSSSHEAVPRESIHSSGNSLSPARPVESRLQPKKLEPSPVKTRSDSPQAPSYNLMAEMQKREAQQERSALAQMHQQLSAIADQWRDKWQEHSQAQDNSKLLFARLLNELPKFCQSFNALLDAENPLNPQNKQEVRPESLPPLLQCRIDGDRSVGILDFMGLSISFILSDHRQPLVLPRLGRSPLMCGRIVALQGDLLDIHSPLYDADPSQRPSEAACDLMAFELASLYIGADANAPVVMRVIAATLPVSGGVSSQPQAEEVFLYPRQAPRAFLMRLIERLGQCGQSHETLL